LADLLCVKAGDDLDEGFEDGLPAVAVAKVDGEGLATDDVVNVKLDA
jgi:hypothetical protein